MKYGTRKFKIQNEVVIILYNFLFMNRKVTCPFSTNKINCDLDCDKEKG